jgi:hypothetical protein
MTTAVNTVEPQVRLVRMLFYQGFIKAQLFIHSLTIVIPQINFFFGDTPSSANNINLTAGFNEKIII